MDRDYQDRRRFEALMDQLLRTYGPATDYQRFNFERDLFMLVRQIYRDAQAPLLEQLGKVGMYAPVHVTLPAAERLPALKE